MVDITELERDARAEADELSAAFIAARDHKDYEALETWLEDRLGGRSSDNDLRASNWDRIAILYAYLEAKLAMCNNPERARSMANCTRYVALKTKGAAWAVLSPQKEQSDA